MFGPHPTKCVSQQFHIYAGVIVCALQNLPPPLRCVRHYHTITQGSGVHIQYATPNVNFRVWGQIGEVSQETQTPPTNLKGLGAGMNF